MVTKYEIESNRKSKLSHNIISHLETLNIAFLGTLVSMIAGHTAQTRIFNENKKKRTKTQKNIYKYIYNYI